MRHRALRSRTGNPGNNGLDEKGPSGARESAEPTAWQGPTRVQLRDELSLHCFELRDSQHQLSGIIDTSLPSDSTCAWPLRAIAPFDLIAALMCDLDGTSPGGVYDLNSPGRYPDEDCSRHSGAHGFESISWKAACAHSR